MIAIYLTVAICVMAASGLMALPANGAFQVVDAGEAATVWGGGCTEVGESIEHCCSCYCATWGSNTNDGNAVNSGSGSSGTSTLYCPCDTTNGHEIAGGSCSGGT